MSNASSCTTRNRGNMRAAYRRDADRLSSPAIDTLDTSSQVDELVEDDIQAPSTTTLAPPPPPPLITQTPASQTMTLDTLILPVALREEQLCPEVREKLVEARQGSCSQCLRHGRECVQTTAGSWKCRECMRLSLNGCEWHLRTVAALGEKWKRPPVDLGLRRRLVASGVSVDRLRVAPSLAAPRTRKSRSSRGDNGTKKQRRANPGTISAPQPVPVVDAHPSSSTRDGPSTTELPSVSNAVPVLERIADQLTRLADCGDRIAVLLERKVEHDQ
ncbi:hypothetical protein C8T65DRAFT_739241 [Cerioporus squamosus]|nr:hypothetical protein C8T65DRAFT_739241 [Cerioporus squamosus]